MEMPEISDIGKQQQKKEQFRIDSVFFLVYKMRIYSIELVI